MNTNGLAWVASALVAYTYLGYPLLAALLGRARPFLPRVDPAFEPTVSVCLAVHNGVIYLEEKMESLLLLDYPHDKLEFLIYSDGSTDATVEEVAEYARRDGRIRLLSNPERQGKPTALNRLRAEARGEVLLMTDVRQPLSPGSARSLVRPLADPRVGCVSGRLVLSGTAGAAMYWRYESWIRRLEARSGTMVGTTGPLYAVRREDLDPLPPDVLLDDMWVPLRLVMRGRRNLQVEDARAYDRAFGDRREFARKARTLAGNYQLIFRAPKLLVPFSSPVWLAMLSHKWLRLTAPFLLAVLLIASLESQSPAWRALAALELSFYSLAAVGPVAGLLARVARTFVVLNAAAVVGLWRYAFGLQKITW